MMLPIILQNLKNISLMEKRKSLLFIEKARQGLFRRITLNWQSCTRKLDSLLLLEAQWKLEAFCLLELKRQWMRLLEVQPMALEEQCQGLLQSTKLEESNYRKTWKKREFTSRQPRCPGWLKRRDSHIKI